MQVLKWLVYALLALALAVVIAGQLGLLGGQAPADLGVRDGRLKPPSHTDNSVSSQAGLWPDSAMRERALIAPLALQGDDGAATMARIKTIVETMPGAKVIDSRADYLYARFTSRVLKFVDDSEFWFDPRAQVIQVRSASRVGRNDFGVNRARIEAIRTQLQRMPAKSSK